MKARSGIIVRTSDPESVTNFAAAEHEHLCREEDSTLRELYDELVNGDLDQFQIDTIGQFVDLVKERRTKFASVMSVRKARIAGSIRK